ncbi:hypothetical protein [Agrobacterium sp. NPDC090283]|uniref:hypothetical protein n=1 Tax=Agrobacterium sp. NPDC090283 TaxID=3363920 RepID=UPI00383AD435
MSENLLIIDTTSIINLFAQRGQAGWDALFNTNKRVVVLDIMVEEMENAVRKAIEGGAKIPVNLDKQFKSWLDADNTKARGAIHVPYNAADGDLVYRDEAKRVLKRGVGDQFIRNFIEGQDADAMAARRAAGIGADAKFRLLTDDMNFVKKLISDKGIYTPSKLAPAGHYALPYAGTVEFWNAEAISGRITPKDYLEIKTNFESSGRNLSGGFLDSVQNKHYDLKNSWLNQSQLEAISKGTYREISSFLTYQSGAADPHMAIKGGILAGAIGLAHKFGLIGDVVTFSMTATQAAELREQGKNAESNELWMRYIFETGGGAAGAMLGVLAAGAGLKGLGGPIPIIASALLGGVVGSLAGAPLGSAVYKASPESFDPIFDNIYQKADEAGKEGLSIYEAVFNAITGGFGFTLDPAEGTERSDIMWASSWGERKAGAGDDILIGWTPEFVAKNQPVDPKNPDSEHAKNDLSLTLDGGSGNDWVIAIGGERATTIGGTGRDWIWNRSNGGVIYGDTIDGIDPATGLRVEDSKENSDNIWFSANTVMMDAQKHDVLKFYGLPMTGGNAEGGLGGLITGFGAVGGAIGLANLLSSLDENGKYDAARSIYTDHLLPWMSYGFRREKDGQVDMYITNQFDILFLALSGQTRGEAYKAQQQLDAEGILKGWMKIRNIDIPYSFLGQQQFRSNAAGTFNMVFKAPNPLANLLAIVSPLVGAIGYTAIARLGGLSAVDQALTLAAAVSRFAKGLKWAEGTDPLIIDLDGDGIETTEIATGNVYFDVDGDLFAERTGWLKGDDGFLVRDLNGNSRIDDISEMFGGVGRSGYAQLAELDANGDGKITRADILWSELRVWQDYNRDGVTDAGELKTLDQLGIVSLDLGARAIDIRTPQGARLTGTGDVTFESGAVRRMFDAILMSNDTDTKFAGEAGHAVWQERLAKAA